MAPSPSARRKFYSPAEVAKVLGYNPQTVRLWLRTGELPTHCYSQRKVGGPYKINPLAVQFFEDNNRWPTAREFKSSARNRRRQRVEVNDAA